MRAREERVPKETVTAEDSIPQNTAHRSLSLCFAQAEEVGDEYRRTDQTKPKGKR